VRVSPRLFPAVVGCIASLALSAALLAGCGGGSEQALQPLPVTSVHSQLVTAEQHPGTLNAAQTRALVAQAGTLLTAEQTGAGASADARQQLKAELASFKGTPVVVNLWAEWCVPCRAEMPLLQREAIKELGHVVFLGLLTKPISITKAQEFLTREALSYPSLIDKPGQVLDGFGGLSGLPKTIIYDAKGNQVTVHQGAYASLADLDHDVQLYAKPAAGSASAPATVAGGATTTSPAS